MEENTNINSQNVEKEKPLVQHVPEKDFHGIVRGLFIFFLVTSAIRSIIKLYTNLALSNATFGIIMFICEVASCVFLYMVLKHKAWGILALFGIFLLQIPLNWIVENPNMGAVYYSAFLRIGIFSLLLLISKDGISGWQLLFGSSDTLPKETNDSTGTSTISKAEEMEVADSMRVFGTSSELSHEKVIEVEEKASLVSPQSAFESDNTTVLEESIGSHVTMTSAELNRGNNFDTKASSAGSKHGLSKIQIILISSLCTLFLAFGALSLVIALKTYPGYITSLGDKWKYTFARPNDRLAKKILGELIAYQIDGQFFFDREDGAIVESSDFYQRPGSILNYLKGCNSYLIKDTIRNESEIDSSALYTVRWSYGYKWASVKRGGGKGSYAFDKMIAKDPDLIYIRLEPVDLKAYIKKEEEIVQKVTSIPSQDYSLIKKMIDHYVDVENYNRAVDVAEFYLPYNKKSTELLGLASFVNYKNKDYDRAEEYAENALFIDPKAITPIEVKSYIADESLNWGDAMRFSKKAIDYGSNNADMYYIYSRAVFKQGEIKLAQEYYNKGFKMDRFSPYAEKYEECGGCPLEIEYISVGNVKSDQTVITDYGNKIYSSKTQYLSPKIHFSLNREAICEVQVKLYCKGKLQTEDDSLAGYTYDATVFPWTSGSNEQVLGGWGNPYSGNWPSGNYRFEIWYKGKKLAEERFTVY